MTENQHKEIIERLDAMTAALTLLVKAHVVPKERVIPMDKFWPLPTNEKRETLGLD